MNKKFEVNGYVLATSSYTQQKETDWCVGVGSACACHRLIGDSKTRSFVLGVDNTEFASLMAVLKH